MRCMAVRSGTVGGPVALNPRINVRQPNANAHLLISSTRTRSFYALISVALATVTKACPTCSNPGAQLTFGVQAVRQGVLKFTRTSGSSLIDSIPIY